MENQQWNDMFIPGTHTLQNKTGATNSVELARFENVASAIRLTELLSYSVVSRFGLDTFQTVHKHVFQDVYEWAGDIRKVPESGVMSKGYPDVVNFELGDRRAPVISYGYFPVSHMRTALSYTFGRLESMNWLRGLSPEEFIAQLAEVWGEVNAIHPFREGNTRTQTAFFTMLAARAGHYLDASKLNQYSPLRERFIAARFHNMVTADSSRLAGVIRELIIPGDPGEEVLEAFVAELER